MRGVSRTSFALQICWLCFQSGVELLIPQFFWQRWSSYSHCTAGAELIVCPCWRNIRLFLNCVAAPSPKEDRSVLIWRIRSPSSSQHGWLRIQLLGSSSGWSTVKVSCGAVGFVTAACAVPVLLTKSWHFQMKISVAGEQDCSRFLYFPSLWARYRLLGELSMRKWVFRSPEMLCAEYNQLKNIQ